MTAQTLAPPEQIVQLSGISWQTYETLLAEIADRQFRLTYNRGNLEIMVPSPEHEVYKKLMGRFVETLVGCAMRTGSSCNVRNIHRKSQSQPVRTTLQITKFQAFSALKTKLSKHARQGWVLRLHPTNKVCT